MNIWKYTLIFLFLGIFIDKLHSFKFIKEPKNMTVNVGDDITMECRASETSLYFTWEYKPHKDSSSKEGSVLGFCYLGKQCVVQSWNEQIHITNSSQLTIRNISSRNSGQYFCETTPSDGYEMIKTSAWIFVKTPPASISIDFDKSQNIFKENELIRIKCSVTGSNPAPRVVISLVVNNRVSPLKIAPQTLPLSNSNEVNVQTLWRPNHSQHRGFVMCTAINSAGSLTKNSSLVNIYYAPNIQPFKFNNISAMVNQTIDLICLVTANPPATVQWFIKNGLRKIASSQLITKVQQDMAGNLSCLAENSMGSTMRSLKLIVLMDPIITLKSQYKIKENNDGSITCHVKATPDPDFIKWYKVTSDFNRNSLLISNDAQLNFIKTDRSSTGKYVCVTKNTQMPTFGKLKEIIMKKYIELIVTYIPGEPFTKSDSEVKVQKDDPIRILCFPNNKNPGEPFPNLVWIDVDTRNIVSESHEFYVKKAQTINNGNYQCAARNELGVTLSSKIVTVSVNEAPVIIFHTKPNIFLGYSFLPRVVTLPCTFQGQPLNTVNWYYQGLRISANEDFDITTYRHISQERATLLSSNITIKLYSRNFLLHSNSKSPPSGMYSCESTNQLGTSTFDYNFIIKYPPIIKINSHERKVAGSLGQNFVSMRCQVESIGESRITWFRTSDKIDLSNFDKRYSVNTEDISKYNPDTDKFSPGIKMTELKIFDLLLGDFTSYSCVATNDQGTTKRIIELVFKSKPDIPDDVKVSIIEWDSITISWKSGFNGGIEQSFEINVYSDSFGRQNVPFYTDKIENKLTLKGLHPNTNYSIQLFAVNVIGKSLGSIPLTCKTKQIQKFDNIHARILSDQPKVAIIVPDTDLCANLDYTRDNGHQWFNIQHCVKFNVSQVNLTVFLDISQMASIYDLQTGMVHLRLTFCLLSRPGICSNHMILDNPKNDNFTTQTVILIIAVICFILIIVLAVLFIVCCIRFKYSCGFYHSYWCYYCCCGTKYHRSKSISQRPIINKRACSKEIMNDGRITCEGNFDDMIMTMGSPSNYCSGLIGCSTPHIINNKLVPHNSNDIYSSFTCQHQVQPPIYYEGSSFLQPTLFSWPQNLNSQSYEASSSNSHSSAGSSSRTANPKSCLKYRPSPNGLSNSVIINQKSLFELNEKMQLPDVTSEAIHFVKSTDIEHVLEAVV